MTTGDTKAPAAKGKEFMKKISEKDIVAYACQDSAGLELREEDIALRKYSLNFAQGDKSPFDNVKFYRAPNFDEAKPINREQVSLITPSVFQEHVMRLFVKDARKLQIAKQAFKKFAREVVGVEIKEGKEQTATQQQQRRLTDVGVTLSQLQQ